MTRSRGFVDSIVRYPVKGLSGVPARDPVRLDPGRGLRGDRAFAIARRDSTPSATGWLSREHFFHLARHQHLARISLGLVEDGSDSPTLVVETSEGMARGGRRSSLSGEVGAFDSAAIDDLLRRTPGADHGEPRLIEAASEGLWDWEDAHLSIINLATLEELERETGVSVDRRRFRANLYFTGLAPFEEFELVGARIRVGEAELEVFQPTDRCRATTIRPVEGVSDLNVRAMRSARSPGPSHLWRASPGGRALPGCWPESTSPTTSSASGSRTLSTYSRPLLREPTCGCTFRTLRLPTGGRTRSPEPHRGGSASA